MEFGVDFVLGEAGANQPVAGTLWVHPNHGFCGMFDIGPWAGRAYFRMQSEYAWILSTLDLEISRKIAHIPNIVLLVCMAFIFERSTATRMRGSE